MTTKRFSPSLSSSFEVDLYKQTDRYRLANHPELAGELFKTHGLDDYLFIYDYFEKDTCTAARFHGKAHAIATALNCFEGALYSGCTGAEVRAVLVAGLFHDVGYDVNVLRDEYNIKRAKNILTTLHEKMFLHKRLDADELALALNAIGNSRWPHVGGANLDTCSKILRDADAMTPYLDEPQRGQLMRGLHAEDDQKSKLSSSVEQFCGKQVSSYLGVTWRTSWAKLKAQQLNWPQTNKDMCAQLKQTCQA